jgi:serine carboxypeptidase-like clade 2
MVGFSYSNSSADAAVGDARTAADALALLLGFVERRPRHTGRPLFLAGSESGSRARPSHRAPTFCAQAEKREG